MGEPVDDCETNTLGEDRDSPPCEITISASPDVSDVIASNSVGIDNSEGIISFSEAPPSEIWHYLYPVVAHRLIYDDIKNRILASDEVIGGPETFLENIYFSFHLVRAPKVVSDMDSDPYRFEPILLERGNGLTVTVTPQLRCDINNSVIRYLHLHPGEIINIQTAADREPGAIPVEHRIVNTEIFCMATYANCLRAAVANAISTFSISDATVFLRSRPIPDEDFDTLTPWMEQNFKGYKLQECSYKPSLPDEWVMNQEDGVFVLILLGYNHEGCLVKHVVAIDASADTILDSCELNMLRFTWSALNECTVDYSFLCGIDIRRVHQVPLETEKHKEHEPTVYDGQVLAEHENKSRPVV